VFNNNDVFLNTFCQTSWQQLTLGPFLVSAWIWVGVGAGVALGCVDYFDITSSSSNHFFFSPPLNFLFESDTCSKFGTSELLFLAFAAERLSSDKCGGDWVQVRL